MVRLPLIAKLSPTVSQGCTALAERVLDAVADVGYGEFDGIIPATPEALGQEGLEHLKRITKVWADAPPTEQELEQYLGYGLSSSPEDSVRRNKHVSRPIILADVADAQGDVDACMARYSEEQLTYGTIAPRRRAQIAGCGARLRGVRHRHPYPHRRGRQINPDVPIRPRRAL